jgi:hypothetical protein
MDDLNKNEAIQLAEETFSAFFGQFTKDEYTKLVLEVLFEELLSGKNLPISRQTR